MWVIISFTLFGVVFGIIIGGKIGVDSCYDYINDNVAIRIILKRMIKCKEDKSINDDERKEQIYKFVDILKSYVKEDSNETRN